jgi:hypothetical protein
VAVEAPVRNDVGSLAIERAVQGIFARTEIRAVRELMVEVTGARIKSVIVLDPLL